MAVMYSKLGGCLGVTAKLGPLARTDLWAGVKGLLERLMTHLGLGSSLEEPWGDLLGGVEEGLPSREVVLISWGDWVDLCLGGCLLPCLEGLVGLMPWPAWVDLEDGDELSPSLCGRRETAWEELFPSPEGRRTVGWEELLSSPKGRWATPGRELLTSPGGRGAIARVGRLPDAWLLAWGELVPSEGRWTVAGG